MYLNPFINAHSRSWFGVKPGHEMYLNKEKNQWTHPGLGVKPGHEMYLNKVQGEIYRLKNDS